MDTQPSDSAATLLSTIQQFTAHHVLQSPAIHPYAASSEDSSGILHDMIQATNQVSHSLNLLSSVPLTNPKLVSNLRQQTAISHTLHVSDQNISQTVLALRNRSGASYGEDIPLNPVALMDWVVSRLESWGTSVGMETFKDNSMRDGDWTVVLGGKVLVLDIDFSFDSALSPKKPRIDVERLKTSYAAPNNTTDGSFTANTEGSSSLNALLAGAIREFLEEVQKDPELQDAVEAERLGKIIVSHLKYLMILDKLATRKEEDGGGIRWFVDADGLVAGVEKFAGSEADAIAASLSLPLTPLDIYLQRSHGLPLPYLGSPALSFLIYLSPLAYFSIFKTAPPSSPSSQSSDNLPKLDIALTHLRERLSARPRHKGVTIATLTLSQLQLSKQNRLPLIQVDSDVIARPTFPFAQPESYHAFPQLPASPQNTSSSDESFSWILDFTSSGQHPGVVMSQSRMHAIESVLDPSGMGGMDDVGMMGFGGGQGLRNWVDLLLNPAKSIPLSMPSSERYTSLYRSPSSAHPPLQLRLTTPDEPGFVLDRIRVKNMKEVWGILEIVKEQCWLNEILNAIEWVPEGFAKEAQQEGTDNLATEDMLQALLKGTHAPAKIPVEVYIPTPIDPRFSTPDFSFDVPTAPTPHVHLPPKITMSLPERPPISGFVEIVISYDHTRSKGVKVDVGGGMGMGIEASGVDVEMLEEVCRRGGVYGLAGRVWQGSSSAG